jgi:S1-C subfamily serine protease
MRRTLPPLLVVAMMLAACTYGGSDASSESSQPVGEVTIERSGRPPPPSGTAQVVERALDTVVNVRATGLDGGGGGPQAEGSGVIIDDSGIIVTNNHVVAGAVEVEIVFTDDHARTEGRVLGTAPEQDLAVIKIDEQDLNAIEVGESEDLRLGDDVVALGFPLGLGGVSVTKGIVSAKNRNISVGGRPAGVTENLVNVLQTDAAINPGNSGGPLVNAAGQLIGINTAAAQAGAAENIGFAIEMDAALPVVEEIIEDPPDQRAWLGVTVGDVSSPAQAAQFNLPPDTRGVVVLDVFEGEGAARAGIAPGEVISAADGTSISNRSGLTQSLAGLDPGDTIALTLLGPEGEHEVDVTLTERPVTLDG